MHFPIPSWEQKNIPDEPGSLRRSRLAPKEVWANPSKILYSERLSFPAISLILCDIKFSETFDEFKDCKSMKEVIYCVKNNFEEVSIRCYDKLQEFDISKIL
jgi:hypothetical protein